MSDGTFASKISATRDDNAVGNPIHVILSDGTENALITAAGELNVILGSNSGVDIGDVDVTSVIPGTGANELGKAVDDVAGATDTGVAILVVRDDTLTTLTPVDGDYVQLRTTDIGALWTAISSHTLTNANALPISKDNSPNAELNPIFVKLVAVATSASEFDNFKEDSDVASDATGTHTFTASNTTLFLTGVDVSGSGAVKFEIKVGPAASTTTRHIGFLTGKEGDLKMWRPPHPIEEAGLTPTVEVIKTNRQGQAVSIYSTIYGQDV